jgi:hypothetical protein
MDDTECEMRATSSDDPPEGLPAPPDAYIDQTEYQDICADIRERMPSYKRRRNELRLMEPVTTNKPDAEVITRLAFWEKIRRDDGIVYNLQRLTKGMSAEQLREDLVNKFGCDRRMLRSSTHKGDANKEELQSTYILFARAAANPDATPNTTSPELQELRNLETNLNNQQADIQRLRAKPRAEMTTDELAHMESVDSKMSEIRRAQSEQRAADREAEKDRQGAAAVRAQEEEQFEQQMHDHKTRMYENLQRRKARRDVPPGRQAAAICSGEKTVEYWSAMGPGAENEDRRVECQHCGALHFPSQSKAKRSACCEGGRLKNLPRWEAPKRDNSAHRMIYDLWRANSAKGRLFRKHCRKLNSALALSWLSVDRAKRKSKGAWSPTLVVNGKLTAYVGPLVADDGETPSFAQLYVLGDDATHADAVLDRRLGLVMDGVSAMCGACKNRSKQLPANTHCKACADLLAKERAGLRTLLGELTIALQKTNPWVKSFVTASEELRRVHEAGEDIEEHCAVIEADAAPAGAAPRTYNAATNDSEILMCMPEDLGTKPWGTFVLKYRNGGLQVLDPSNRCADPTHFPLLFPNGETGWSRGVRVPSNRKDADGVPIERSVTPKEWYNYYSYERRRHPQSPDNVTWDSSLQRAGRLYQEYICWGWIKAEDRNLSYIASEHGQRAIRAEKYNNLADHMCGTDHLVNVGRIVLPCTVRGSPRKMKKNFEDAMATVRVFGTPSLFITFTASGGAPEVAACLHTQASQTPVDRWDLVSTCFHEHVTCMIKELMKDGVLGDAVARFHVLEFQKRGLPHVHLLIWLVPTDRPTDAESIDSIISAQLPNQKAEELYRQVCLTNVHKCDTHCLNAYGGCSKHYPKPARRATHLRTNTEEPGDFVQYRRDSTDTATMKGGRVIDSLWIVPYSPYMSLRHRSHVNVEVRPATTDPAHREPERENRRELTPPPPPPPQRPPPQQVCSSSTSPQYLCKYFTKGGSVDRAMVMERIAAAAAQDINNIRTGGAGAGGGARPNAPAGSGGGTAPAAPGPRRPHTTTTPGAVAQRNATDDTTGDRRHTCICRAADNNKRDFTQKIECRCHRQRKLPPAIAASLAANAAAAGSSAPEESERFTDEVEDYICDRRVVGSHSALLALQAVPETELVPPTESLQVHLPGEQTLYIVGMAGDAQQRALDAVARRPTQARPPPHPTPRAPRHSQRSRRPRRWRHSSPPTARKSPATASRHTQSHMRCSRGTLHGRQAPEHGRGGNSYGKQRSDGCDGCTHLPATFSTCADYYYQHTESAAHRSWTCAQSAVECSTHTATRLYASA